MGLFLDTILTLYIIARVFLKKLKHIGTMGDYMKEFTSLLLDVKVMFVEYELVNLFSYLQS